MKPINQNEAYLIYQKCKSIDVEFCEIIDIVESIDNIETKKILKMGMANVISSLYVNVMRKIENIYPDLIEE